MTLMLLFSALLTLVGAEAPTALTAESTNGKPVGVASLSGERVTVFVFLSPSCPISNGYIPTLNELSKANEKRGVRFVGVYSPDSTLKDVAEHAKSFHVGFAVVRDSTRSLAAAFNATHTPEAVVRDGNGVVRYRGRIDDRYTRRGGAPREPRRHDVADALQAVLDGRQVVKAFVAPIGCPLESPRPKTAAASTTTFHAKVEPILQKHCQTCHRAGGAGPFPLVNYSDAAAWASDVVAFTQDGTMPPWRLAAGTGEFHNERRMSDAEKGILADWLKDGCPEGDPKEAPKPLVWREGWQYGTPDLILTPGKEYTLGASGRDEYRCFVLPTNFDEDKYIAAFEILPGNRKVVHHVISFLDTSGAAARLDAADPAPGYATSAGFPGFLPSGGLGGWAPGNGVRPLPDGVARVLPKGASVVMQVHYHRTGKPEVDRTQIGLYFVRGKVERAAFDLMLLPVRARFGGMRIQPEDSNYETKSSLTLSADLLFFSATPHMHLLGKDLKVTATLPGGEARTMIDVRNWDFNWQETYRYREPILLPAGTRLDLVAHHDNSSANPWNPNSPPKLVRWGEQTNDEMCIAFFETAKKEVAKSPEDLKPPRPGYMLRQQLWSDFLGRKAPK